MGILKLNGSPQYSVDPSQIWGSESECWRTPSSGVARTLVEQRHTYSSGSSERDWRGPCPPVEKDFFKAVYLYFAPNLQKGFPLELGTKNWGQKN